MKNILEARNLKTIRGGSLLVDVPGIVILEGETLSIIGPNGAGKTTLLQALSFLMKPSTGEILFRGKAVGAEQRILEYRRRLAMVFQEPLLFDTTVFGNVASGLKIRGLRGAEVRRIVEAQLERFGITPLRDRSARTLSGGEAQRVSLARAFAISPEILFLDEPFAALDPPTREAIVTDLERVLAETKTTTIMATHDRNEALRLSNRIAVMEGGRIAQVDRPAVVLNQPVDEFVASFVGMETILEGEVRDLTENAIIVRVNESEIEVAGRGNPGERMALCIRPENVTLSVPYRSARNVFRGRIMKITPLGFFLRVEISCGFPLVAYITIRGLEDLALQEGIEVSATLKASAIHAIHKDGREQANCTR
jgi:tungstate transport system ATP-binding protein